MNCETIKKIIDKYYEAKLTKQEMAQISKHLKTCVDCKKDFTNIAYENDHYSLGKETLDRLTNDFIELNLKWEI